MGDSVKITVYRWAGKKWFLHLKGECIECDLTVSQVRTLVARNPNWPIELEVKPWLTHIWESLRHGGWHAPVLFVDGRLVQQGTVPTYPELEVAVRLALTKRGIPLGRHLRKEKPIADSRNKPSSCCV
jgi:prepilin-type processing-associated H-X9-DG protein